MRRLALILLALAASFILAALSQASGARPTTYRVDAIFDDARGLIPGQLVKVAGARVGTIDDITLTPDFKARIQMTIDGRFAPFRADATCTIRPEGLLAENYVECQPGTAAAPALGPADGHAATVPVSHTTEPVNLTDLFNIWNVPTRDRLTVLLDELGIGTAARGEDINAILRRANPTLTVARRAIAILTRQRRALAASVDNSDRLLAALAAHRGRLQAFISAAGRAATLSAAHRGQLSSAVARLPALLGAARPALRKLDLVARVGTPLVNELRASAPAVNRLSADLGPFARAARPALASVGRTLTQGTQTAIQARPALHVLRTYSDQSLPNAQLAGRLFVNLRDRGFFENLLHFFYNAAASAARFDSVSHILPSRVSFECSSYAQTPTPGCSARFTSARLPAARDRAGASAGAPSRAGGPPSAPRPPLSSSPPGPGPSRSAPGGPPGPAGALPLSAPAPSLPHLPAATPSPPPLPGAAPVPPSGSTDRSLRSLLGYFLR